MGACTVSSFFRMVEVGLSSSSFGGLSGAGRINSSFGVTGVCLGVAVEGGGTGGEAAGPGTGVSTTGGWRGSIDGEVLATGSFSGSETVGVSGSSSEAVGLQSSRGGRVESPPCLGLHCSPPHLSASRTWSTTGLFEGSTSQQDTVRSHNSWV